MNRIEKLEFRIANTATDSATYPKLVNLLATLKAEAAAPAAPAGSTTVYPTKVGRAQTIHAAGFIGGDFQSVDFGHTACGTRSSSYNANTARESAATAITCTKCLNVDPARRR